MTPNTPPNGPGRLLGIALVAEGAALVVTVLAAGGGHGTYAPAKVLFPYSMALTAATGEITSPLVVIALAQYPAYAVIMWALRGTSTRQRRWIGLACVHVLAVAWAFVSADSSFTP